MYDQPDHIPHTDLQTLTVPLADDWRPLATVCRELEVPARRGARWAQQRQDASLAAKHRRAAGGSPQWWLSPSGTRALRLAMLGEPVAQPAERRLTARLREFGRCLFGRLLLRSHL